MSHESNPGVLQTMQAVSELGGNTVSTYCKGQAVIALSSGEAEYYGLVSATSQMLDLQILLLGWGWGSSMPMCGWTPQLDLRLGADEGSDE